MDKTGVPILSFIRKFDCREDINNFSKRTNIKITTYLLLEIVTLTIFMHNSYLFMFFLEHSMDEYLHGPMGSGLEESNILLTSCAAAAFENPTVSLLPISVDVIVRSLLAVYGVIQVILGIFLNSFILLLVYKFEVLRITLFIVSQVAIIRCLSNVINQVAGRWVFGLNLCLLIGLISVSFTIIRSHMILVFSTDRFASVFWPFFYPKHNCKIAIALCPGLVRRPISYS